MLGTLKRRDLVGRTVYDINGEHLGKVADTWPLDGGGEPQLMLVKVGHRFPRDRYLPLRNVRRSEERVIVPHTRLEIEDAPAADDRRWGDPALIARAHWLLADDD